MSTFVKRILGIAYAIVLLLIVRHQRHGILIESESEFRQPSSSSVLSISPSYDVPVPERLHEVPSRLQSSPRRPPRDSGLVVSHLVSLLTSGPFDKPAVTKHIIDALQQDRDPLGTANAVIDQLPTSSLAMILTNAVGISDEDLTRISDVRTYAKNLAKAAMEGVVTSKLPNHSQTIHLSAMASLIAGVPVPTATAFSHENKKIYAQLGLSGYQEQAIIAKWYRKDNPSLVSIRRHAVELGSDSATIWMLNTNGWNAGEYGVEFISITEDARHLGEASFSVY